MSAQEGGRERSIRQQITNRLRERKEDAQFGLQRYAIERFLYRLGASPHRERFVLKGASLFALWGGSVYRPTRDLDFTGYGSTDQADVLNAFREICAQPGEPVELVFDADSITAKEIRVESEYKGLRIKFKARLGKSEIRMQIDVGFANAIQPPPQDSEYPTLLDDPPPNIRSYPREGVVAEKFHAMVTLGERNSRYKDFYDIYTLSHQFPFDGERLAGSVAATFKRRSTSIDGTLPVALTPRFYANEARATQWRNYLTRNSLPGSPHDFEQVGEAILAFLRPMWVELGGGGLHRGSWPPGGPWKMKS